MRAEHFYETSTDKTIPLIFLTKADCLNDGAVLKPHERNSLKAQQFDGCIGNMGVITDADGMISKIYVGAAENTTPALAIASVVISLPEGRYSLEKPLPQAAMVAWSLAQYQFDKYKPNPKAPRVLNLIAKDVEAVVAEAAAVFLVRDLINTPANDLGPEALANVLASVAHDHGAEFQQWVGDELLRDNFPAIHAVGRAAAVAPRLLSMVWGDKQHPCVVLVGKGVCFDTGGLDIKPSSNMRFMKKDMGGAAHVIGLAQWLMTHQVPIRLHVLIPAVENSIAGSAYRPGDVLTMRNGLKVEVHNTDAEGRLVLADALVKACEEKPELIINFATLTGAARVAMGTEISALFANDDTLANALSDAARETNDPIWRLPLFDEYADLFSSRIADFTNASDSPYGGAITAALFLKRFITAGIPWAHFDIMAWNLRNKPGKPEGGEAMGMRAVGHYLRNKYS